MTDNEIIKALECCANSDGCENCPYSRQCDGVEHIQYALDLINRQKAENDDLLCKLTGVMYSVDKWLSVEELKQDEVSRAITMREKTLQIVEKQNAEIKRLQGCVKSEDEVREIMKSQMLPMVKETAREQIDKAFALGKVDGIIEFAERIEREDFTGGGYHLEIDRATWDEIKKRMVGEG